METFRIMLPGQTKEILLISDESPTEETIGRIKNEVEVIFNRRSVKEKAEPWEPLLKKCVDKFNMDMVYPPQRAISEALSE